MFETLCTGEGGEEKRRFYPPAYLGLAALLMVGLHLLVPITQLVQGPYRYLGFLLLAAGLGIVIWVNAMFQHAGTTIKPFEESSALVVGGPFRYSRNPIYVGMVVFLLGVGVLLGSLTPLLVIPIFAFIIQRRFIHAEEAMLARTFGAHYDEYRARVRRWI
jgi:protein-S-isoprenylcysteine O-methyltransferase Ste14